jgi:hypothetical protein
MFINCGCSSDETYHKLGINKPGNIVWLKLALQKSQSTKPPSLPVAPSPPLPPSLGPVTYVTTTGSIRKVRYCRKTDKITKQDMGCHQELVGRSCPCTPDMRCTSSTACFCPHLHPEQKEVEKKGKKKKRKDIN